MHSYGSPKVEYLERPDEVAFDDGKPELCGDSRCGVERIGANFQLPGEKCTAAYPSAAEFEVTPGLRLKAPDSSNRNSPQLNMDIFLRTVLATGMATLVHPDDVAWRVLLFQADTAHQSAPLSRS